MTKPRNLYPALLILLCSCGLTKSLDIARQAADQFHRRAAAGEADAIYGAATDHYRTTIIQDPNRGQFARLRRKMGTCANYQSTGLNVNASTSGTYVTTSYRSVCENGTLDEVIVWPIENGAARLWEYRRSSPHLLVD